MSTGDVGNRVGDPVGVAKELARDERLRDLELHRGTSVRKAARIDRWALLVGISRYAHEGLRLEFAHEDALALRRTLSQPGWGGFEEDHILELVDEKATLANLTKALRTFLKRPGPDDLVVLFFACHGARDRERPDNLYLLPHDADPGDISGTALPMREVDLALKETLNSRNVVVLVDACHSGGLGDAFAELGSDRSNRDDAADLNAYLGALSQSRGGVSLMTSAMSTESSREGKQWGDGHGVFTHFLLEGLQGKADQPPYEGIVTVGELFDYVSRRVAEETHNAQHPHISAGADRGLALAATGAMSASQHLELADRLAEAAELLGEAGCWRGAAVHYDEALRLHANAGDRSLAVERARALFRAGERAAAEEVLERAPRGDADGRRTLGLVQLANGRTGEARHTLLDPDPAAPWVHAVLSAGPLRPRLVVLVAVDAVSPEHFGGWSGELTSPVKEARAFAEVLEAEFGFDEKIMLFGKDATVEAVRWTLADVVARSSSYDAIAVLLSGHGAQVPEASGTVASGLESTFVAFDGSLTSAELASALRQSAAGRTTLVVSAGHSGRFAEQAGAGGFDAISSCGSNQVDADGANLSLFMEALLPQLRRAATVDEIARATLEALGESRTFQRPVFTARAGEPLFTPRDEAPGAGMVAAAVLGATASAPGRALEHVARLDAGAPPAMAVVPLVGEWWRRGELGRVARTPLGAALESIAAASAAICAAARAGGDPSVPRAALERLRRAAPEADAARELEALAPAVAEGGTMARLRAVLVGVRPARGGARRSSDTRPSVTSVRDALVKAGASPDRVAVLLEERASARDVRAALRDASASSGTHATLVYWCGPSSDVSMTCQDGEELTLVEIAELAGPAAALLVDDADARAPSHPAGVSPGPRVVIRSVPHPRRKGRRGPPGDTAQAGSPGAGHPADPPRARERGMSLAAQLARVLEGGKPAWELQGIDLETPEWTPFFSSPPREEVARPAAPGRKHIEVGPPIVLARILDDPLVPKVDALVRTVVDAELGATAALVDRLLERRNGVDPEGLLQRGILKARLGDEDAAIDALERAVAQFSSDAGGEARARLRLGRLLMDGGRDRARAVSECRQATLRDPGLVDAQFWLGRSIARLIEQETAMQAAAALRKYLASRAPLEHQDEAARLLAEVLGKHPVR